MQIDSRTFPGSPMLIATAIAIAAAIFVLDTITELDVAFPVLYVAVVLIAVRVSQQRTVLLVSLGCIALTLLSAYLSVNDHLRSAGIVNSAISILAIISTAYLGLKNQSASHALQDARAELAHLNRVATLGELTAAIAHEVNQPIAGAVTNAEAALRWLAAQPPDLKEVQEALGEVVEDGKRASEIVTRIRALLTKEPPRRERVDINEVIVETIELMRSEIRTSRILLQTALANDLPPVLGDRIQLQQLVLNLMLNSAEAMSSTKNEPRELLIGSERQGAHGVLITVRDRGPGLDEESCERIFQPFYTNKAGGIGVGLSICRSIVAAHGGRIWASANAGPGATFQFSLPGINR